MELSTILPSIITGAVTALGTILGFITATKENKEKAKAAHDKALADFQANIESKLDAHKVEYMGEIAKVNNAVKETNDSLTDLRAQTQTYQAVMEERFNNLEAKVMKHNNFMERVAVLEKDVAVLQNRESVSEHRLTDLEQNHE
jgi:chromosome segregation ATPase